MFELDQRLRQDTIDCGSFPLSRLLLMNDCSYPWFILVPQRENLREFYHLEEADRQQLWVESIQLSLWMDQYFHFDKLNVAELGNIVSQLHLHHVGRRKSDPAWPGPVWGHRPAVPYPQQEIEVLRQATAIAFADLLKQD
ncbi:Diadenosine tetraphosphate (Ap4A) hydrolase [Desulfuromusa kysingii]|uniref:Diadenosine tetraphosphate (Ap4A) hydrolase n=1 Tax=Desulfuromusa kysingii TaxID=37625 RepID=A0A1H3ZQ15_9BACT|nr:HIT domain-containing protein [Desulfuromusa kysingii]SEA25863.1 Diadenosine tetraphosphate (Ap4A) hydrolase [Desulfuromusa kysingii]